MNLKKRIKKFLGMDDLEKKIALIEAEKAEKENKLITSEKTRNLIKKSVEERNLSQEVREYFRELDIPITEDNQEDALIAMGAAQAIEEYGFRRFAPEASKSHKSNIITLKELRENPEEYFHKLGKGFMKYPLDFNLIGINKIFEENFGNMKIEKYSSGTNNGVLSFAPGSVLRGGYESRTDSIQKVFYEIGRMTGLNRTNLDSWAYYDPLDFLYNYQGLVQFIIERPDLNPIQKERGIRVMEIGRLTFMTALEILANTRIRQTSDILKTEDKEEEYIDVIEKLPSDYDKLRREIRKSMLSDMPGTTQLSLDKLVTVRSKEKFRELASKRTLEIMAKDVKNKGFTSLIDKELKDYSIPESITMACYFARNIITNYEKEDDAVKRVFSGITQDKMSGKCSDYTGLALQYLNEYLVPLNAENFKGWTFGYEEDYIGYYEHVYIKAIHEKQNGTIDVFFIDPTMLSSHGLNGLKTPESIMKKMDADYHPVEIKRDAEDFLTDPIE